MIKIYSNFFPIFDEKNVVDFLKTNVMIQLLHKITVFWLKNTNVLPKTYF
jgi:hypothetical protein